MIKKITEKRKLELQAEKHLIQILYDAKDRARDSILTHPLTEEEIQNVIDNYLF